jgi:hypothetical protein
VQRIAFIGIYLVKVRASYIGYGWLQRKCGWPKPGAEASKNNKISWTTFECISLLLKSVYRVGESHSYILDTFCHLTNPA